MLKMDAARGAAKGAAGGCPAVAELAPSKNLRKKDHKPDHTVVDAGALVVSNWLLYPG